MRVVLCRIAILSWAVFGFVQFSTAANAHETASVSQPAAGALSMVAPAYLANCPSLSEHEGAADVQVYCSNVFLAGEAAAIQVPGTARTGPRSPDDSDIAAVLPTPDPPPPRV